MKERDLPERLDVMVGAFPADSAAPGGDNLYDEDPGLEVATEISDLEFSNNVPRRVIRALPQNGVNPDPDQAGPPAGREAERRPARKAGIWFGILGMASALLSWAGPPVLFGALAVVCGACAFFTGRKALGGWTMVLGLISSLLSYVVL